MRTRHSVAREVGDCDFAECDRALLLGASQAGKIFAQAVVEEDEIEPRLPQAATSLRHEVMKFLRAEPIGAASDAVQPGIAEPVNGHSAILPTRPRAPLGGLSVCAGQW